MANTTKVNPSVWGAEETWLDLNSPTVLPEGYNLNNYVYSGTLNGLLAMDAKLPYLPKSNYSVPANEYYRSTWRGAFIGKEYHNSDESNIVLDYNTPVPIDKIPVCWGIGNRSALANSDYVFFGYRAGTAAEIAQDPIDLVPMTKPVSVDYGAHEGADAKTLPFSFTTNQNTAPYYRINYRYRNYAIPVLQSYNAYNGTLNGNPILSFNYQKVVVYPTLYCGKYDDNDPTRIVSGGECTIGQYFDGVNYDPEHGTGTPPKKNTYPLILSVVAKKWYCGTDTETATGRRVIDQTFLAGICGGMFDLNDTDIVHDFYYNGDYRDMSSQIQNSRYNGRNCFQAIMATIGANGILSGSYGTSGLLRYGQTIVPSSHVDDINQAWVLATQTANPTFDVIYNNGHYTVHAQQSKSGNTYGTYIDWCAVWDTEQEQTTKEDVLRDVAFLGFWFSEDENVAKTGRTGTECNDPLMHIPVFDRNGVTTGEYKSGTAAAEEDNASWDDPYKDNPYKVGGGGDDDDFGDLNNRAYRGVNFYNLKMYALTEVQLLQFLSTVNALYTGDPDAVQMDLDFKGSNPNEYIVGVYGYPFDIPNQESLTTINLGPVDTGVQCRSVNDNFYGELTFGDIYIAPYYNDFRDYEPYTTIEMFVPLCGTVKLDPALYIGHTVSLYYDFDPATGNLTAKICRDDLIDKVIDGSICVQIPITATNMGDYQRSIHQIKSRILQTAIGAAQQLTPSASFAMAAATENVGGMVSNAPQNPISVGIDVGLKAREIRYDMTHNTPHVSVTGTADPLNAINMDNHAYIFIKRAKMIQGYDADIYSHTVGNACVIQSLIGDMSGLIRCSNVDLSGIPATADEITAINNALKSGIYV